MVRWVADRRRARGDDQRGYTFVELIISIVILTMITGALGAAFVTAMNGSRATVDRVRQSNDAQVIAAFFVRDAQAAGGSDPNTASVDTTLGVSPVGSDPAGCTAGSGLPVVRFKWLDRLVVNGAQTSEIHVASYNLSSGRLTRQTCITDSTGSKNATLALAHNVQTATATCITGNAPSACGPNLPDAVQLTVRELRPSDSTPTSYTFTLTGSVRPQGQAFTKPPSGVLPFSPALFALGACSNGKPGVSVSGGGSGGYVTVGGAVVVNGVDNSPCTAMSLSGNSQYSATSTSIQNGGTCGGSNCAQAGTIGGYPTQLLDPYAGLTPPGDCNGPQTGSLSGGHYTPGRYLSAVSVNSAVTFDSGNYILCNGISFQSQANVTANGVLFYVASGTMSINGQATVSMTAASSGLYKGMLIWIPATNPVTTFVINGGSTVNTYDGLIYAPNVDVTVNGGSGTRVASIIARTISFSGGGQSTIGNPPSVIGPATLPDWTVGNDYGSAARPATMTATGGTTPYTWSATGLPTGLSINASTGVIGGTPSATGTWSSIIVTVTDARGLAQTKTYSVTINPLPSITAPATLPASTQGVAYPTTTINASGGTPTLSWFASGLPAGMSINTSTGAIGGTPTASGTFTVTVTVADVVGVTKSKDYPLTINSPPTIGTTALPEWTQDRPYSTTVSASSGTPPYTWSATGLPNGLSIGATNGVISGTTSKTGTFSVTVTITDSVGAVATKPYSLTINKTPSITFLGNLPASTVNRSYPPGLGQAVITATGGTAPYAWSDNGTLPNGLTINSSTGVISGTPTATGTSSVTITMTDAAGATASRTYSLTINVAPTITPGSLPNWTVNQPNYNATVSASGGTTPYSWSVSGLPAGLTFNPSGANSLVISGTPTATGTFTVTVTVTDTAGATASHDFPLTITSFGPATKLVFTQQPSNSIAGAAFTTQPQVAVEDSVGNIVTTDSSTVTLAITSGTPTSGGPGALSGCTQTETSGVITFSGCKINTPGTGYKLHATDGSLTAANTAAFNITIGTATQLVFTQQPSNSTAGAAFATQPQVAVEDSVGNIVTTDSSTVTLAITSGTPTSGGPGALSGCTQTETSGVITFSGCKINTTGTGYKLHATVGSLTAADSSAFNITIGAASKFLVTPSTSTPNAGSPFNVTLTAQDAGGNTVTSYTGPHTITWSGATTSPAGSAPSYPVTAVTFSGGVSTTTLTATLFAAGNNTLTASATGPTVTGFAMIAVTAAGPSSLAFTNCSANNGAAGSCGGTGVAVGNNGVMDGFVSVVDSFGNNPTVSAGSTWTVTIGSNNGSFVVTNSPVTITGPANQSGTTFHVKYNGTGAANATLTGHATSGAPSVTDGTMTVKR